jgi:hypothetical protein
LLPAFAVSTSAPGNSTMRSDLQSPLAERPRSSALDAPFVEISDSTSFQTSSIANIASSLRSFLDRRNISLSGAIVLTRPSDSLGAEDTVTAYTRKRAQGPRTQPNEEMEVLDYPTSPAVTTCADAQKVGSVPIEPESPQRMALCENVSGLLDRAQIDTSLHQTMDPPYRIQKAVTTTLPCSNVEPPRCFRSRCLSSPLAAAVESTTSNLTQPSHCTSLTAAPPSEILIPSSPTSVNELEAVIRKGRLTGQEPIRGFGEGSSTYLLSSYSNLMCHSGTFSETG